MTPRALDRIILISSVKLNPKLRNFNNSIPPAALTLSILTKVSIPLPTDTLKICPTLNPVPLALISQSVVVGLIVPVNIIPVEPGTATSSLTSNGTGIAL